MESWLKKHYKSYKLLKDLFQITRTYTLNALTKYKYGGFLEDPFDRMIILHTLIKQKQNAWNIYEMKELQDLLSGNQLLVVEVKPSVHLCQFRFLGPPASETIFVLKEGPHFHDVKDPTSFFGKYCHFYYCCEKEPITFLKN